MGEPISAKQHNLCFRTPELELPFSFEEYRLRLARIRAAMAKAKIDLLYLTSPIGRFYASGFNSDWYQVESPKPWYALGGVAIHVDNEKIITFERQANEVLVRMTTIGEDARILRPGDSRTMAAFIVDSLREEGWLRGTAALEKYSHRPNSAVSAILQEAMEAGGCKVVDGTDIIRDLTIVKSPQELAYVRVAASIGDLMMRAAKTALRAGVTELDVYAEMVYAGAKAGGEHSAKAPSVASGPRTLCTDAQTTRRKLMPGDIVNIDICGCYNRYHTNFARTFSIGEPHPEIAKRIAISAGGFNAAKEALRSGMRADELGRTLRSYYRDAGIWEDRWWVGGYDVGIAFAPDWVGPYVWDPDMESDRIFVPGTVINCESDFFLPRGAGLSLIIDSIVFDEMAAEFAHATPPDLIVIE